MFLPLIHIAAIPIRIHLRAIRIRHHNRAIRSAKRTPHNIRTGIRCRRVVNDDGAADVFSKVERRVGHDVVDGVVYAVGGRVADGQFVDEDPFVERRDEGDDGHSGPRNVLVVGDVVDDGAPGFEIGGGLVGEFLAVFGVALVGVVGD
jgi:hypothetical protein